MMGAQLLNKLSRLELQIVRSFVITQTCGLSNYHVQGLQMCKSGLNLIDKNERRVPKIAPET